MKAIALTILSALMIVAASTEGVAAEDASPSSAPITSFDERDMDAFIARNKSRNEAERRQFNKRDADLKHKIDGICSNC